MALNQFGAILTFAIELEQQVAAFYEQAAANGGAHQAEFAKRAQLAKTNADNLEKSRRQNVTEITLEPIEGLDDAHYQLDLSAPSADKVNAAEALIQKFYEDITPKINVLETRQTLKRCQKEHKRLEALSG